VENKHGQSLDLKVPDHSTSEWIQENTKIDTLPSLRAYRLAAIDLIERE